MNKPEVPWDGPSEVQLGGPVETYKTPLSELLVSSELEFTYNTSLAMGSVFLPLKVTTVEMFRMNTSVASLCKKANVVTTRKNTFNLKQ